MLHELSDELNPQQGLLKQQYPTEYLCAINPNRFQFGESRRKIENVKAAEDVKLKERVEEVRDGGRGFLAWGII